MGLPTGALVFFLFRAADFSDLRTLAATRVRLAGKAFDGFEAETGFEGTVVVGFAVGVGSVRAAAF